MLKLFKPMAQEQIRRYVNEHLDEMISEAMAWHRFMKENGVEDD